MEADEGQIHLRADWSAADTVPWAPVNNFIVTLGGGTTFSPAPDGVYISAGFMAPPAIYGTTPDEIRERVESLPDTLPVQPVTRFYMTTDRARELHAILGQMIERADDQAQQAVPHA